MIIVFATVGVRGSRAADFIARPISAPGKACDISLSPSAPIPFCAAFVAAGWALALASGPGAYARFTGLLGSPLGVVVLLGFTGAFFYHFAGGIRHLVFDAGKGLNPKLADMTAIAAIVFAVAATAMVFGVAFLTGALDGLF